MLLATREGLTSDRDKTLWTSAVAAALVLLTAGPAFAQATTGKIRGRLTDEATGAPIAGAEVLVVGTTFGNRTDDEGYYFINGVPAGLQSVRAMFIGYRTVEVTDERILAGQVTTMDFQLTASPAELEPLVLQGEGDPPGPPGRTSTRSVVLGEMVDQLPLDDAAGIVVLQPGVVEATLGPTLRGGLPNEAAVMINGVLVSGFGRGTARGTGLGTELGTADDIALPTNALEQVGVNVGVFSAEFGDAQSGLVSFVTKSGGPELTGSFEAMSDRLGPEAWRTNFDRVELTLGGPIAGPVTFFLAGTFSGQDASTTEFAPNRFVIDGPDTCDIANFCEVANGGPGLGAPATFRLPRAPTAPGVSEFVDVTAPRFVEWENGRTVPHGWNERDLFHANLNWQLPRGSRANFSFTRNREQSAGHAGFGTNFLVDGVDGALSTRNAYALSWFQTLKRTAEEQLALDILVGFSQGRETNGMLDQTWWVDHDDPSFGFFAGNVDFAFDDRKPTVTGFDAFDPSEEFINAYRSGAVPFDSMTLFPGRGDLAAPTQSLTGLSRNLRSNPYGLERSLPVNGAGNEGLARTSEDRLQLRGTLDWQFGRFNRMRAGAEYLSMALDAFDLPLVAGGIPQPASADPRRISLFVQDRLEMGAFVLDAGLRYDRLDTNAEYPIVPGFVFNVPDSLTAGLVRFDPGTGTYAPRYDVSCNGASVCKSNFIEAETKSELSPRVGVSVAASARSTFRFGYGRFVQPPPGLLRNANLDLTSANPNTAVFPRDVEMPSTRLWEIGYRWLIGDDLVVDLSGFLKRRSGALAVQTARFEDPNLQTPIFVNVLTNADPAESMGFEISIDKSVGSMIDSRLSYSFLDDRDEDTAPSILGLSRRHNINWMGSLSFPTDFEPGTVAGAILRDVGLFTIVSLRSGLPFTRLLNRGRGQIGPPGTGGLPASAIDEATTPWTAAFDFRLTKGFQIGRSLKLVAFVDWRNPFDIETSSLVFLETGSAVNDLFRGVSLAPILRDTDLDGDNVVDDFDIRAESPENRFNVFMLLRAEQRFGNGNGIFTVAEQEAAFGQMYDNDFGVRSRFKTSDQLMRLGLRIAF